VVVRGALIGGAVTIALAVGAAFLLSRFSGQIGNIFSSAGETIGGAIGRPISGFIGGLSAQLGKLPDFDLRIPGVNIQVGQGTIAFDGDNASALAGQDVRQGETIVHIPDTTVVNPDGTVESDTPPVIVNPPTDVIQDSPLPPGIPQAEAAELTKRSGFKFIPIDDPNKPRVTFDEFRNLFPGAVGVFDLPQTQRTEFLPLGVEALEFFQSVGQTPKLSFQVFNEIKNTGDAI